MSNAVEPRGLSKIGLQINGWLVYLFFYAPIVLLVIFSFSESRNVGKWGGFTLGWYEQFIDSSNARNALENSIKIAIVVTIISVILGTMSALALERFTFKGKRVFDALLYLPIIIPDVTMAVMLLLFFGEFFEILDNLFGIQLRKGFWSISISHIAFNISFVSVVVRARLAGMSTDLEEAAVDLYASRWKAFRHVTFPQILPGIAGGALLAMTLSLDDVVITQFVAGPGWTTVHVYVFGLIRKGVTPLINSISVIMLVSSMLLVGLSLLAERTRRGG